MTLESLIGLLLVLALVGFILYRTAPASGYTPPRALGQVIIVVAVILLVLWILSARGILSSTTPLFHR